MKGALGMKWTARTHITPLLQEANVWVPSDDGGWDGPFLVAAIRTFTVEAEETDADSRTLEGEKEVPYRLRCAVVDEAQDDEVEFLVMRGEGIFASPWLNNSEIAFSEEDAREKARALKAEREDRERHEAERNAAS